MFNALRFYPECFLAKKMTDIFPPQLYVAHFPPRHLAIPTHTSAIIPRRPQPPASTVGLPAAFDARVPPAEGRAPRDRAIADGGSPSPRAEDTDVVSLL